VSTVEVRHAVKRYGAVAALDDVSLAFGEGEFFGLLGPSGSGKTTLLRAVAGFVELDAGEILFDGAPVADRPVHRREIGMVFQNYALFPHLTVRDNIAFGLAVRGRPAKEIKQEVKFLLGLVRLTEFARRKPRQLSGGQQQRVALARALATRPRVLLLDEPLGALDKRLRQEMQVELKRIQRKIGITTIFVTHDQEEALTLSDRIAILNEGRILQVGRPAEVYERPATSFAASFLGSANLLEGRVVEGGVEVPGIGVVRTADRLPAAGTTARLAIRPEKFAIGPDGRIGEEANRLKGVVRGAIYTGTSITYEIEVGRVSTWIFDIEGVEVRSFTVFQQNRAAAPLAIGTPVELSWSPANTILLAS
jgi:spermidine/putrescine transport system ATP-binding protein